MSIRRAELRLRQRRYDEALTELLAEKSSGHGDRALAVIARLATDISEEADDFQVQTHAAELADEMQRRIDSLASRPRPMPNRRRAGLPVTTGFDLAGTRIEEHLGEVFGVVVRWRGAIPVAGAKLKSVVGGELGTMTNLLEDSRRDAIARMAEQAEMLGADAVIAMRFGASSIFDGWAEICAYGAAVRLRSELGAANKGDER